MPIQILFSCALEGGERIKVSDDSQRKYAPADHFPGNVPRAQSRVVAAAVLIFAVAYNDSSQVLSTPKKYSECHSLSSILALALSMQYTRT